MAPALRFVAAGENFQPRRKSHANGKSHKIAEARLESGCLDRIGGFGRRASFYLFILFFLRRFHVKYPSTGYRRNHCPAAIVEG
jgi:hypothetical protein